MWVLAAWVLFLLFVALPWMILHTFARVAGAIEVGRASERGCDYVASVDREAGSPLAFKRLRHITAAAT
jgi:hypothetical protein